MNTSLAAAFAAIILGAPALAQAADWDLDRDGLVSREEFDAGIGTSFEVRDLNDDGYLDEEETGEEEIGDVEGFGHDYEWASMDIDRDGLIGRTEYGGRIFTTYDKDLDDFWSEEESGLAEDDGWF